MVSAMCIGICLRRVKRLFGMVPREGIIVDRMRSFHCTQSNALAEAKSERASEILEPDVRI